MDPLGFAFDGLGGERSLDDYGHPNDTAPNALFVSIAQAMGVQLRDSTFGDARFGSGPLSQILV